jgi:hypothetical protein
MLVFELDISGHASEPTRHSAVFTVVLNVVDHFHFESLC